MDKFNGTHLAFLLAGTSIVSLKTYPKVFIENGHRDSWVALIISSLLIFVFLIYIIQICKKNNAFNMVDIYQTALGKPLGNFFLALYGLTLFLTLIESATVEANSMHVNMLVSTPTWFFVLLFVGPAIYTIKQDLVAIVTVTMIGLSFITMAGINLAALTQRYKHAAFLFPIFEEGVHSGFFLTIIQTLGLYAGIAIILPYFSKLGTKKRLLTSMIIGMIFIVQMEIISITGLLSTFEVARVNTMPYPKLIQTQLVSHFRFLEAGELFVMLQIIGGWYLKYVITFYALIRLIKSFKRESPFLIYLISTIVGVISFFVSDNLLDLFAFLNVYTYIAFANFFAIPLIVFGVFALKSNKKTQSVS